jgi:ribosome recycling factor
MPEFIILEGQTKPFEDAVDQEMTKSIKHFEQELTGIRTGRAHPSMVEDLKVSCYGGTTELPIKNLATVLAPEPRVILIQPWDQGTTIDIERALKESDLGIAPQTDGPVIRLVLPDMSSTRREELIKLVNKKLEESRVTIRNVRKHFHNLIRDTEKEKGISEDFAKRISDLLQKHTDKSIKFVEDLSAKKEVSLKS